jgi:hypothetical protein
MMQRRLSSARSAIRSLGFLLSSATAVVATSCASPQHPLTANAAAGMHGRRLSATARPPTPFFVSVPAKGTVVAGGAVVGAVAGGAVGAANQRPVTGAAVGAASGALLGGAVVVGRMAEAGARIIRENAVIDPAADIARKLSDDLHRRYGLDLTQPPLYIMADDPKQITATYPQADLVLDVSVENWDLGPSARGSAKYRVRYAAHLRLIDAKVVDPIDEKKGRVIAHGVCHYRPEEASDAATYDQLLANGARRLKDELEVAARFCVDQFRSRALTGAVP